MSLKSSKKINTNRYELEVEVSAEKFEEALEKAYRREVKRITVPGFRKGKAPRAFIEKYYGDKVFYEDAINNLYPDALEEAVKEGNLDIIEDKIDLDIVEVGKNGLIFKAAITVKPEVEIEGYKGIEVKPKSTEVTDRDVEDAIKKVQERNSRLVTVEDREAQNGDIAVIDFEGFVDGVAFDGGKGENYSLELGAGHFIPGFEDQVVGHKTGEQFDVVVTFPEDYHASDLAGKEAVFKINLHEIKVRELPELDDEFVKDVSEFDTLSEYKEDMKNKLVEMKEKQAKDDAEHQMLDKLVELVKAEIPEAMIENKIKEMINEFAYRLQSQGLDIESYIKYTGLDNDSFKNSFRPQAEHQVKVRLALEKIANLENVEVSEKELNDEYDKIAQQYNMKVEQIKGFILESELKKDLAVQKAIELVRENSVIL